MASAEENRHVTGLSPQLSQQKAGLDMESHRRDLRRPPLSSGVNSHNTQESHDIF